MDEERKPGAAERGRYARNGRGRARDRDQRQRNARGKVVRATHKLTSTCTERM